MRLGGRLAFPRAVWLPRHHRSASAGASDSAGGSSSASESSSAGSESSSRLFQWEAPRCPAQSRPRQAVRLMPGAVCFGVDVSLLKASADTPISTRPEVSKTSVGLVSVVPGQPHDERENQRRQGRHQQVPACELRARTVASRFPRSVRNRAGRASAPCLARTSAAMCGGSATVRSLPCSTAAPISA
jgi:hypothetical protein